MNLKADTDLTAFLEAVRLCTGEVYFRTEDGDNLNLKSFLSYYLFSMIASNQNYMLSGKVICDRKTDYEVLSRFLQ